MEEARCPAHGSPNCLNCSRTLGDGVEDGECRECSYYAETGMHWDTCPYRDRSPVRDLGLAAVKPLGRYEARWRVHRERPGMWVVEHPVYGRHAVMGSWVRAYGRAYGAAVKQMEGR